MKTFVKKALILASLTGCIASPLQAGIGSSIATFLVKNFWIVPTILMTDIVDGIGLDYYLKTAKYFKNEIENTKKNYSKAVLQIRENCARKIKKLDEEKNATLKRLQEDVKMKEEDEELAEKYSTARNIMHAIKALSVLSIVAAAFCGPFFYCGALLGEYMDHNFS